MSEGAPAPAHLFRKSHSHILLWKIIASMQALALLRSAPSWPYAISDGSLVEANQINREDRAIAPQTNP